MKTRKTFALVALLGLVNLSGLNAAQKDEAADVLAGFEEVLQAREDTDPALLAAVAQLIADETTDPAALTDILREMHPAFGKALEAAADTESDAGVEQLKKLAASEDPFLAAESAYYLGRTLMARQRNDDALPYFIKIQDDYFDQSLRVGESIYYQGICEALTLQRDAASMSLNDFVDLYPDAPERLINDANDTISRIENVFDGSIEDVADHMDFVTNKLMLIEAGEETQEIQNDVIAMLDELIEQAEQPPESPGGSPQGAPSPSPGSQPGQNSGSGSGQSQQAGQNAQAQQAPKVVRRIRGAANSKWDDMRDRERGTEALSAMKSKYPSHYKELVEQYFRDLQSASEESGE